MSLLFQDPLARRRRSIHVVLLEQDRADQAQDRCLIREDSDDVGATLDLLVETLDRVRRVQLGAVLAREGHVGEDVVFAGIHEVRELGPASAELFGHVAPGLAGVLAVGLIEGLADRRGDDRVLPP